MQLPAQPSDEVLDRRRKGRAHASDRRYNKRVKVDMFVNRFLNGQPYMCRMIDISRTGARLVPIIEPDGSRAPALHGTAVPAAGSERVLTGVGVAVTRRRQDGRCSLHQPAARRRLGDRIVPQLQLIIYVKPRLEVAAARPLTCCAEVARARINTLWFGGVRLTGFEGSQYGPCFVCHGPRFDLSTAHPALEADVARVP